MKIILLILLSSCTLLNAEYPRHKLRGPPHSSRIPPSKQFAKKWHQQPQHPPRGPVRSRPIPLHMPPGHKIPMGVPQAPPRNVGLPVRTFWKNPQTDNIQIPQDKPYLPPPPQQKPFLAAPSISSQELDFHIQTNSIPTTHTNPIKQVGEKGPIHTIPAPNLSLRDKPIVVEEVQYHHKNPYKNVEQTHQYQVTEPPESLTKAKFYRGQQQLIQQQLPHQLYQQQLQQQQVQQSLQHQQQQLHFPQEQYLQHSLQKQIDIQPQQVYYTTDAITLPNKLNSQSQNNPQSEVYVGQLDPELYKLIGAAYPQQPQQQLQQQQLYQQQQLQQQPQLQQQVQIHEPQQNYYQQQKAHQIPNYQALLSQKLFQADQQDYEQQLKTSDNSRIASDKISFEPEFQSFNYDEQAHQKSLKGLTKEQLSSLVTAAYNLDSNVPTMEARNSIDPLAQAQLIQNYFDTRSDVVENDVEPDAKPSSDQKSEPDKIKEELLSSSYFSSLPSKEAAERLAHLQAAGKINSNLMKITNDQQANADSGEFEEDVRQESSKEGSNESYPENAKDRASEYEDYSQEDENVSSEEKTTDFGKKN